MSVSEDGLVYECDTTNEEAECSVLSGCYESSVYEHCSFELATTVTLVADPDKYLSYPDAKDDPALEQTSYFIFYSDSSCDDVEGIRGVVNNESNPIAVTSETVPCRDAMACAFHGHLPGVLNRVCRDVSGLDVVGWDEQTPPTIDLSLESIQDGQAVPCFQESDSSSKTICEPVDPNTCQKSTLYPSCYYRLATAATFFGNPGDFLVNFKGGVEESAGEAGGSSNAVRPSMWQVASTIMTLMGHLLSSVL